MMAKAVQQALLVALMASLWPQFAAARVQNECEPEQIRIALGRSPTQMAVAWTTMDAAGMCMSTVEYWASSDDDGDRSVVSALGSQFTMNPGYNFTTHRATMDGLKPSMQYSYRVGHNTTGWSSTFDFRSSADGTTLPNLLPQRHVIFGDLGASYAYSMCRDCGASLECTCLDESAGLISEIDADMFLQVGDFAYNFDSSGGLVGDTFMRNIEQFAARVPFMVCVGNHEDSSTNIAHYTERFSHMPVGEASGTITTNNSPKEMPNNWFYSWDAGLVHYVAMSTEVQARAMLGYGGGDELVRRQYEFLLNDLKAANKRRDVVPWIVVNGHRSIYCSCDADCDEQADQQRIGPWLNGTYGLEELFYEQGVDIFINGHEHNYERNWPVYQNKTSQSNVEPGATIYIVTGAAGNDELHEPFTRPQPPHSAFRSNQFGYSRMFVHNASHLRWQQVVTDPDFFRLHGNGSAAANHYGEVIDDTWIVQHNHGPFSEHHRAPTSHDGEGVAGVSIDHWEGVAHPVSSFGTELPDGWTWRKQAVSGAIPSPDSAFLKEFAEARWENAEAHSRRRG